MSLHVYYDLFNTGLRKRCAKSCTPRRARACSKEGSRKKDAPVWSASHQGRIGTCGAEKVPVNLSSSRQPTNCKSSTVNLSIQSPAPRYVPLISGKYRTLREYVV